ncbi:MAG: HaeIII family restriction endonuclease [Candidatus Nomurabacteria bacterium]|jgi:hypothetical protein|nr:HaeIII family restriction endonuclease [Candidatus Nomurabacteria bacterium]
MDTTNSTIKGKAYEYACVLALQDLVSPIREIEIVENESLEIAKARYDNDIAEQDKSDMLLSARSGIQAIIEMEPKIIEDDNDRLTISLQPDSVATKLGDIRDVLIIRRELSWEIGVSVKHNHAALKHSRLSARLDFGNVWFGVPCSQTYFNEIAPIFAKLKTLKDNGELWRNLPDKEASVYVPLLNAFVSEFNRLNGSGSITADLVKYLLGSNGKDYYKLIHNNNHTATIMPFNLFGTLNQTTDATQPIIIIPEIELPTRIIEMTFKENSKTTVILTMNNGWSISFRIHNASSKVETSLKFDIQLQSKPEDIFYINREW